MAVRLIDGTEFLHIPKTGGSWVIKVLQQQGLFDTHIGHPHSNFDLTDRPFTAKEHFTFLSKKISHSLFDPLGHRPKRFCFVRHPLRWYESWWKYMEGLGWPHWGDSFDKYHWHPNSTLNGLGSSDFNEFIFNVIKKRPGYVTELYSSYTKEGITYIGKTENLRLDLSFVLENLNLKIDKETILAAPDENTSRVSHSEIEWDSKLRDTVLKLELPTLIHFGYPLENQALNLDSIPTHSALIV